MLRAPQKESKFMPKFLILLVIAKETEAHFSQEQFYMELKVNFHIYLLEISLVLTGNVAGTGALLDFR